MSALATRSWLREEHLVQRVDIVSKEVSLFLCAFIMWTKKLTYTDFVHFFEDIKNAIIYLNVSKFQNEFMKSSFLPKYEPNIVRISARYCTTLLTWQKPNTIFGSYFWRNYDFINSFWHLLTFSHLYTRHLSSVYCT